MFKKSKDGGARKPIKNRHCNNTLVLAGGKTGDWTSHDLRRTSATMMQSLGERLTRSTIARTMCSAAARYTGTICTTITHLKSAMHGQRL